MKKVLALTLALVLALSMSTVAFAAPVKVKKEFNYAGANADVDPSIDMTNGTGTGEFTITIDPQRFTKTEGTFESATEGITKSDAKRLNVGVKLKWKKGSIVMDEAKIDDNGDILIKYSTEIATIKDVEYEYQVQLTIGGRTITKDIDDTWTFSGTYVPVDEETEDNWFQFTGSNYVKPTTFIRDMEFVIGDDSDISVHGRALKNVKYYAKMTADPTEADQELMIKHREIVGVYHITQINLASVADHVVFNNDDSSLFVYGLASGSAYTGFSGDVLAATSSQLVPLGKVGDKNIPFYETYYLATAAINDLDVDEEPEDIEDDDDGYEPDDWGQDVNHGGDDLYPSNPHDNPGTGK